MTVTKLKWGKYEVEKYGNKGVIEFVRNGRYDTFDGKYHPSWLFTYDGKTFPCVDKEHAFNTAKKFLNRTVFDVPVHISKVTKYNDGTKPSYAKKGSTMRGCAWCCCGACVSDLLMLPGDMVMGHFKVECDCGNRIDWSEADKNI